MLDIITIKNLYPVIEDKVNKNLKSFKISMPRIDTKNYAVLAYLYYHKNQEISKEELTSFMVAHFGTNDMQQARHLGKQKGFYILSGRRGDLHPETNKKIKMDHYLLYTLDMPFPSYLINKRSDSINSWDEIKKLYNNKCATCGSKEGSPHNIHTTTIVKLEKGHCDPNKELNIDNIIPQCQECNKSYQDKFIFSKDGKVTKVNVNSSQILSLFEESDLVKLKEIIEKKIK